LVMTYVSFSPNLMLFHGPDVCFMFATQVAEGDLLLRQLGQ
jgi:hypothetical protein